MKMKNFLIFLLLAIWLNQQLLLFRKNERKHHDHTRTLTLKNSKMSTHLRILAAQHLIQNIPRYTRHT
jgi:hypothetical protein